MSRLPNYLKSHRKRLAFSQEEVAYLLGMHGGEKVSRYEQFNRTPSLETALKFELIYQKPMRELFAGIYEEVEKEVAKRAKILSYQKSAQENARKKQALENILTSKTDE